MSSLLNSFRGGAAPTGTVNVTQIRKEGWVMKESAMIRSYRRRWLVLTPENLYSFKQERRYENPTEEIDLKLCGTVKSADDLTNRQFTFTVQVPDRNFFLMASSDAERNEWVAAIGRATTESRRVRSYSEEVEYQEEQARLAAARSGQSAAATDDAPARGGARYS
jgi:hypothetical protein